MSGAISGYRQLTEEEISHINHLKALEKQVNEELAFLRSAPDFNQRHVAIAATHLETGFMFMVKAVARPDGG